MFQMTLFQGTFEIIFLVINVIDQNIRHLLILGNFCISLRIKKMDDFLSKDRPKFCHIEGLQGSDG